MSPLRTLAEPPRDLDKTLVGVRILLGSRIREQRVKRRWPQRELATAAGLGKSVVQLAETGGPVSVETYVRLVLALGLRLEVELRDARRRSSVAVEGQDIVHSAMGEFEVDRLSRFGFRTGVDEPYQHYQFAGRADVIAWDADARVLLHIENRTRFPNIQEVAGSWNAKRQYLPAQLAERLALRGWASVTNVMVTLWSAEALHSVRLRKATFRSLCPNGTEAFEAWWNGSPPTRGVASTFVLLDPMASTRQRTFVGLDEAAIARPRYRGYAEVASRLNER
ncbi:MAG TPA: helix-turn-helix transcriptional regulator [Candidatus Limnocylindrales bacterium]